MRYIAHDINDNDIEVDHKLRTRTIEDYLLRVWV